MRKQIYIVYLLTLFLVSPYVSAQQIVYRALVDQSSWQVINTPLKCRLQHDIPDYGTVLFYQDAGLPEGASLKIHYQRAIQFEIAHLDFVMPKWRDGKMQSSGWQFQIDTKKPIIFSARQARRVLNELSRGHVAMITHQSNENRLNKVKAEISTIQFTLPYEAYLSCQKELVPYSFEALQKSNVYFETASSRLDDKSEQLLKYLVEYAKDPDVYRIELSGFTDSVGSFRANHILASHRVEKVRDFLLANGVKEELMRYKVYGEQQPVGNNKSDKGRSQNRRVYIRILR